MLNLLEHIATKDLVERKRKNKRVLVVNQYKVKEILIMAVKEILIMAVVAIAHRDKETVVVAVVDRDKDIDKE